jgi:hypothetical protein
VRSRSLLLSRFAYICGAHDARVPIKFNYISIVQGRVKKLRGENCARALFAPPFGIIESFVSATPPTKLWQSRRPTIGQELLRERTECTSRRRKRQIYIHNAASMKLVVFVRDCTQKFSHWGGCKTHKMIDICWYIYCRRFFAHA